MWSIFLVGTAAGLLRGAVTRVDTVTEVKVPAFDSVLTMLDNLVKQLDEEAQSDETDYSSYMTWYGAEHSKTSSSIGTLTNRLQELAATLAELRSRQQTLSGEVARLGSELDHERDQLQQATQKRTEEHDAFVNEQTDFDNSIAACNKAVELLAAHYGDGEPKTIDKPAWMSLVGVLRTVHRAASKHGAKLPTQLTSLIQASYHPHASDQMLGLLQASIPQAPGSSLHDEYQDQTGAALGIVAQVKELAETFAEDKQEAIEAEADLQHAFDTVLAKKTEIINSLASQLSQQQAVLTQVNQEIGENENAEMTAQSQLQNEQAYLSSIETQEKDLTAMYHQRQKDRADEKAAVQQAVAVLTEQQPALLQLKRSARHARALLQLQVAPATCPSCSRVASLLRKDATKLKSELLATAAAMTGSGSALGPVIGELEELLVRLDEQGEQERKHKEWCETEQTETNAKKAHHDGAVVTLQGEISDTQQVIAEKEQGLADTRQAIQELDTSFQEVTATREKAKADYEQEHADYVAAIQALNQAIDILADFYREGALVQVHAKVTHGAHQPSDALSKGYEKKGSAAVVNVLKDTRTDFEGGKKDIELFEAKAVEDYGKEKDTYDANRASLVDAGNRLTAEHQTATAALSTFQADLASNQEAAASAAAYLQQLGGSCGTLLAHFEDRKTMRAQERKAIADAVDILKQAA